MVVRALIVLAAALLLGGCGGKNEDGAPPAATTATTSTVTTTSPEQPLSGASTEPAVAKSTSDSVKLLTDVRAASHPGFDRLVFEFRNGVPGYDVRYVQPPVRADGSGAVVPVSGEAALVIRMEPALDADLTQATAPRTYTGPTRFSPATSAIVQVVRTGGFEGVLTWAAGIHKKAPFRVTQLDSPARVVIDVDNS
jgi:hypothetical protein